MGVQPGAGMYPPSYQQPKKGPNVGLIIGIILIVVILVGGGIFAFSQFSQKPTANTGGDPTPGATATSATTTKTLMTDSFKDNSNHWNLVSNSTQNAAISGGFLTLTEKDTGYLTQEIPNSSSWNDFQINVTVTLKQAAGYDAGGIWFRGEKSSSNQLYGYYVTLYGDGTLAVEKFYQNSSGKNTLDEFYKASSANVKPVGQANNVRLIVKGSSMAAYVNNTFLGTYTDSEFSSGTLALVVGLDKENSQAVAAYSNLTVSEAPATMPSK
jgi:hypothetical protein